MPLWPAIIFGLFSYAASDKCGLNQVYSTCGPAIEKSCENLNDRLITDKSCHIGCFCKKGHVRGKDRECIKIENCSKPPICPPNSSYSKTGNFASCELSVPQASIIPDCYCNDGFVKNNEGICIPWQNCPCNDPNEIYTDCVPKYPKTCNHRSNNTYHDKCVPQIKGCTCKSKYVLNDKEVCIPEKECPPTPCQINCAKHNAKYVSCAKNIYCNVASNPWNGTCHHGCQCSSNYAVDTNGNCIPLEKCPCKKHATFKLRPSLCPKTCANLLTQRCNDTLTAGCECDEGYVLNRKGDCILEDECKEEEIICPNNMKYTNRGVLNTCENIGKKIKVVPIKGCICPEGLFYRTDLNSCVVPQQCPNSPENQKCQKLGNHLEYKHCQYPNCIKTCSRPYYLDCTKQKCDSGCYCKDGYVQQSYTNQTCVKLNDCTCNENASYKTCAKAVPDTCEKMYQRGLVQIALCLEKCECNSGYYLNSNYECVKEKDCPLKDIKCNSNLFLTLNDAKFWTCGQASPEIVKRGCICETGYHYDSYRNLCVSPSECTYSEANIRCAKKDPNKIHIETTKASCLPTCDDQEGRECRLPFTSGCHCKPGLIQFSADDDLCVLPSQCPSYKIECLNNTIPTVAGYRHYCSESSVFVKRDCICPGILKYDTVKKMCIDPKECTNSPENNNCYIKNPNLEYRGCQSSSCIPTCEQPTFEICTADCQSGCFCKKGLLQVNRKNTTCVLPEDCPITKCPAHAHYSTCASCPRQCSTLFLGLACPLYCNGIPTCVCDPGYAFTNDGKCVLENNCPIEEIECPSNMIYTRNKGHLYKCGQSKPELVQHACICPKQHYYDEVKRICVTEEECPNSKQNQICTKNDVNKEYRTKQSINCRATCAEQKPAGCTEDYKPGCYCKSGFVQLSETNTNCVLPEACPKNPPITCENNLVPRIKGILKFCSGKNEQFIENGCTCPYGMVQISTENPTCVIPSQCPSTEIATCDKNMVFNTKGRLYYCNGKISDWMYHKCICKSGLRFDPLKSTCVSPAECSNSEKQLACRKIDRNMEYLQCTNSKCYPTCDLPNPKHCSKSCSKECFCKTGYLQVSETDLRCVLPSNCPNIKCKKHATLKECISSCPTSCFNMHLPLQCINMCELPLRCECNNGYALNSTGDCIPKSQCKAEEIKCPPNMEYSTCHGCEKNCNDLNPICTQQCRTGCFCKKGYVQHEAGGVCIKQEDCPKPVPCAENEEYVICKNLNPNTCKNLFEKAEPAVEICINGCDCKKGLVRNSQGKCIEPDNCEPQEVYCPANMHFVSKYTKLETCQSVSKEEISALNVPRGCVCNEDLVYDQKTKACVEKSMCPESLENKYCKKKDPNSQYSTFPLCPRTCLKRSPICNEYSEPGCECISGYILLHDNGICIKEEDCPIIDPLPCSGNATQVRCRNTCPDDCVNILTKKPRICTRECRSGCDCKEGYVFDLKGNCILPEDCETSQQDCKDPNSAFTICGSCHRTCSNRKPCTDRRCHRGCFCKSGYIIDDKTGLCIPEKKCPEEKLCEQNSTAVDCMDTCAKTCANLYQDFTCLPREECKKGCNCNKGFVLNSEGRCVLPEDCQPEEIQCSYNMQFSKHMKDFETCESYHSKSDYGKEHCICKPGLVYNTETKSCIDPRLCYNSPENQRCTKRDSNSIYTLEHTCQNYCTDLSTTITKCGPDCICKEGFVLAPNKKCVPYNECPIDCGQNATYRLVNTCKRTCATYHIENIKCSVLMQYGCDCLDNYLRTNDHQCVKIQDCPLDEFSCEHGMVHEISDRFETCNDYLSGYKTLKAGCFCPEPYVYDTANKLCVPGTQCSITKPSMKCPENATYKQCKNTCPNTCCNKDQTKPRICPLICIPGCDCKEGYVLNNKGECVELLHCSISDCLSTDPNAEYLTCGGCQGTCSNRFPICTKMCHKRWFCKDGYTVDDVTGLCIPTEKCPSCPKNSKQAQCVNKCAPKCETMYHPNPLCIQTEECRPGCDCIKGFVLNSEGVCVKSQECKKEEITCPLNMHLTEKPTELNTCESYHSPASKKGIYEYKASKCLCDIGLVYDSNLNYCVDPKLCPNSPENQGCMKKDPNSLFALKHQCQKVCTDLSPSNAECESGCVCKPGYVIGTNGKCIPYKKCPVQCPPNSIYRLLNICGRTCDTYDKLPVILCPIPTTYGCDCIDGYVQNSMKQCVLPKQCPVPDCSLQDPNMEYHQCGGCQATCSNLSPICDRMCKPGCFCKNGYVLDDFTGFCIPKDNCLTCPPNSMQVQCIDKCAPKCETMYHPDTTCIQTLECRQGCNCKKGYVLNSVGWCVKPEQCKAEETTCPINMHLNDKPIELKTCESYYSPGSNSQDESRECKKSRCICNRGLVYDSTVNYCVDPKLCPNSPENQACKKKEPHTVYAINYECERPCTDLTPYPGETCDSGCVCKPEYVRGPHSNCIPLSKCPVNCGANSTYARFINNCENCGIAFMEGLIACLSVPQPGCKCNTGYVKNSENDCVLKSDCKEEEIHCPPDLHYEECIRPRTCEDLDNPSKNVRKGCYCDAPLIFNSAIRKCIDRKLCPNSPENKNCANEDINSEYSVSHICESPCDQLFPGTKRRCFNECICKEGYLRNSKQQCIKAELCIKPDPMDCGRNATHQNQVFRCGNTCNSYHMRELIRCGPPDPPGCTCNEGYVFLNDKSDKCISVMDCAVSDIKCTGELIPDRSTRPATCEHVLNNQYQEKTYCFCKDPKLVYDGLTRTCVKPNQCTGTINK